MSATPTITEALRDGALLVEEPERGTLKVEGPDRATWLNGVVTCDVARVSPVEGAFGLALNKTGKILTDLWVVGTDAELFVSIAGEPAELQSHFERMLVMEDAELAEVSAAWSTIALHGARAVALAERVRSMHGGVSGAIDWTGHGGALLLVARERGARVLAELEAEPGVRRASPEEWEAVRIAAGLPRCGVDYGPSDNPHDASLDQLAVCWTKGCYLGQEVVCMQGMRGKVKRRLVAFAVETAEPPPIGASVTTDDGAEVGAITSAAADAAGGRSLAMARVTGPVADGRPELRVQGARARIVERSFSA